MVELKPTNAEAEKIIIGLCKKAGASYTGIIEAGPVDKHAIEVYERWLNAGQNGSMDYCAQYSGVRNDPRELLPGAKSLIICLFNYLTPQHTGLGVRAVADYALGRDYHKTVRQRLNGVAKAINNRFGATSRVCVDTAPLRERYWAERAGVGFIGLNNYLIVPDVGSQFVIGTIITSMPLPHTPTFTQQHLEHLKKSCRNCMKCIDACPTSAILADGRCLTKKCLAYLTTEARPRPAIKELNGRIMGCDICRKACPHFNPNEVGNLSDFEPRQQLASLTLEKWQELSAEQRNTITLGSALRRIL